MKFILGSAQFGQRYGIYNNKIINFKELKKSVKFAKKNKIFIIDTSFNFKNSNKVIEKLEIKNQKIFCNINTRL